MKALTPTNRVVRRVLWAGPDGLRYVESMYSPNLRLAPHDHAHANISLVLSGSLTEETDRGVVSSGPGCAVLKPRRTSHGNRVGAEGACVFSVEFDAQSTACRRRSRMRRLPDYLWCSQDSLAACLLRTYAFARKASAGRLGFSERTWTDFDPVGGELSSLAPLGVGPPWLTHVRDRVHASTGCVVRVNELANEIGTHPVYLARVFRRYFGSSPTAYLHRVRVTQAAHRIATSADSLCRIAADLGFADQAHLCRRFRSHIGLTPNAFRHLTHPL